jgi:putative peptide zinc metalloprotease protein
MGAAALPRPAIGAAPAPQAPSLPPLRQDLALHAGPRLRDGQPSWTLHDPAKHQYHQLDWLSFEVLAHWPQAGEHGPQAIVAAIQAETTLQPDEDDVAMVLDFLQRNELVHRPGAPSADHFTRRVAAQHHGRFKWLLHNYLFFRIPLLRPDALLGALLPLLGLVFGRGFLVLTALAGLAGTALVARQWEGFQATLVDLLSPAGFASYALTLVGVKTLHELGHGLVAKRHGCRVPTMGLAFMVLWPVPYTDTNDAWRLADRWARLQIAAAGVATELLVAVWATLAWAILPDGSARQAAFLLATTTWVSTLLVNCSPFMRFDGYFVLSDWLEMPNLHQRSFALARWQLREWLFDLRAEPPEHFTPARRRGLVGFAFVVWAYRLALFLGIALLVYGFFIKLVGIVLFLVEIIWFVLMPIAAEVKTWGRLWPVIRVRPRSLLSAALLAATLAALAWPLPGRLGASGLLHTGSAQVVYAPAAGRIASLAVADGATVRAGAPLLVLGSEQEREQLAQAASRIRRYSAEADAAATQGELRSRWQVAQAQLSTALATRRGLQARVQERTATAPHDGTLRWHDPDLRAGDWVAAREPLATVVNPADWQVEAYLGEADLKRIAVGQRARFYPDGRFGDPLDLQVSAIAHDASHQLPAPGLAVAAGGSVATREVDGRPVPEHAVYRVAYTVAGRPGALAGQVWRGHVVTEAQPESVLQRLGRAALAVWWREAGW